MTEREDRPASFREVFAVGEFRALWAAQTLSVAGDQLARVAVAVLVFDRTGSAALTALVFALTFLPALVGGPLLSGLADRYPRREVMIVTDLLRAALVGVMAIPGLPLLVLCLLVLLVPLVGSPFSAARAAVLPDMLTGDRYVVGLGITDITGQAAQLAGFVLGGGLVELLGPHAALAVDAATFAVSAAFVGFGTRYRPAAGSHAAGTTASLLRSAGEGIRLIACDPRLRSLVALAWIYGLYIVPEGLAAPYAHELGLGTAAVGLLMAADPAGAVVGALVLSRLVRPARRPGLIGPLAVAAGLPLIATVTRPGLVPSLALWAATGALAAYLIPANAAFVRAVPESRRGQAVGLAASGLLAAQGVGIMLSGLVAEALSPAAAIAIFGVAGTLTATAAAVAWHRARTAFHESPA